MSIVLSYDDLEQVKRLKNYGWKLSRNDLMLFDWTPENLRLFRTGLGLTQKEVAEFFGVTAVAVSAWETGRTSNPIARQMYGIFLERYYACLKGYVPAYRKIGADTFAFAEELDAS